MSGIIRHNNNVCILLSMVHIVHVETNELDINATLPWPLPSTIILIFYDSM